MKTGILGGTFDPVHNGHLFIAETARVSCGLDRVIFVPNQTPPHKLSWNLSPAEHRLAMVRLALEGNPYFEVSTVEFDRQGTSYSVDTLQALSMQNPGDELYFILGSDSLNDLPTWHQPQQIAHLARFIVIERDCCPIQQLRKTLPQLYVERSIFLENVLISISATQIRQYVQDRYPVRYLTPDGIVEYIQQNQLYSERY